MGISTDQKKSNIEIKGNAKVNGKNIGICSDGYGEIKILENASVSSSDSFVNEDGVKASEGIQMKSGELIVEGNPTITGSLFGVTLWKKSTNSQKKNKNSSMQFNGGTVRCNLKATNENAKPVLTNGISITTKSGYKRSSGEDATYQYMKVEKDNQVSVRYDANGGEFGFTGRQKLVEKGTEIVVTYATPEKKGYKFVGWSTSKNATQVKYKNGSRYTVNSNTTFYAVWEIDAKVFVGKNKNINDFFEVMDTYVGKQNEVVLKYDNLDENYIRSTKEETEKVKNGMLKATEKVKKARFDVTVENKNNVIYIDFKLK